MIPARPETRPDDSIDLMDVLTSFLVEWRRFLLVTLVLFALGAALVMHIHPLFEGTASILPQAHEDSSVASFFSGHSPGDVFIGLLGSRSVADDVIDRADLLTIYKTTDRGAARDILAGSSFFTVGKDTMVNIKVRDRDARNAMVITNAYLEALQDQREKMLARESELQSRFFQQQLANESQALATAEQQLKDVQERSGVVQPEAQTQIGLSAIAGTSAQISSLRVQLSSLLLGESEGNPQVRALRAQIAQLESHLGALQSAPAATGAGAAASARQMPELNLEIARRQREVRYHETLFNSISTQYQTARLSAGATGALFTVVDRAVKPENRVWPPRRNLLLLALFLSVVAAAAYIGLLLLFRSMRRDPANQPHFARLRSSFRLAR